MKKLLTLAAATALTALPLISFAAETPPAAASSFTDALTHGTPTLDMRYRYESVSQDPLANNAHASTLRTRLGYITGVFEGFKAGIELENVSNIGAENYNNTYNGKGTYPIVADPSDTDINQLYISYAGAVLPKSTLTVGRQIINLDNQRFVGAVEWRQNNQTFDAASFSSQYIDHASLYYAYVSHVNRIFGPDAPAGANVGKFKSSSHLINASYEFDPALKLTGYTYLLDFSNGAAVSNATYGLRLTGKYALNPDVKLLYTAETAHQTDYADNPANISENYLLLEPGVAWNGWTGKAGFEVLQGNGTTAFQTPLATLHAFNGWADKFLSTPARGLEDQYASLNYKVPFGDKWLKGTDVSIAYHSFDSNIGSVNYGKEWDASIMQTFFEHYTVGLKFADYNADETSVGNTTTDTTKTMMWVQVKY